MVKKCFSVVICDCGFALIPSQLVQGIYLYILDCYSGHTEIKLGYFPDVLKIYFLVKYFRL